MRAIDFKKYWYYFKRLFFGKFPLKMRFHIIGRYIGMAFSILAEKIRGLDYTMLYVTTAEGSAYTKTPKYILRRVFKDFSDKQNYSFADIGCGKCYVVAQAIKAGFKHGGGIEYNPHLYEIGIRNLTKEKLPVEQVYNEDAGKSEHLDQFDVFFFNNPFGPEILKPVAENIMRTHEGKKCWLYWLNPDFGSSKMEVLENAGFYPVKRIEDKTESYFSIAVYSNVKDNA